MTKRRPRRSSKTQPVNVDTIKVLLLVGFLVYLFFSLQPTSRQDISTNIVTLPQKVVYVIDNVSQAMNPNHPNY